MFKPFDHILKWGSQPVRVEIFSENGRTFIRASYAEKKPAQRKGFFDGFRHRTILDMIGTG